ncbi:hypothetical protein GLOTRDRAFT_112955 [Gloeophyllum trabeum ATCC 11539]|uniref:Fork-head domain-containing protein n=1 Tax=Gloeophyllum trabeum (strain ATCC 11539 / FP-39264 / Madison 617) TaxID=670483 RepID=S7QLK1_GLOTA|nr:uncharacterized protein GLOTRDRAFT_112955 [Gloeophyllum trabeum ATCC 11539]EPQ60262.1 hypothetical protein GLOTRDRAFT_112955 [Gloeophyllum trabeum ATCC 11539]
MASLTSLLNPQNHVEGSDSHDISPPPTHALPSPASTSLENSSEDVPRYTPPNTIVNIHPPHPHCPDTLACLPDTNGRPQHTLPVILRCAILGSAKKRLTIREIYAAMEEKYPYYKTAGPTWKQSVRHHLSLNRLFERQPRPVTDPGFGSYWTVNLSAPPGTKRPRKRGRTNKDVPPEAQPGAPKKRGRPRKSAQDDSVTGLPSFTTLAMSADRTLKKCKVSALRTGGNACTEEDEDELMEYEDRPFSEDECESEERDRFILRKATYGEASASQSATQKLCHIQSADIEGTHTPNGEDESPEAMLDRLRIEMAGLKRQSADAVSLSERMSDQLMEAQAEVSRAKQRLRALETMLEEEARKRREAERLAEEAERLADEEAKRRREVEEAIRSRNEWVVTTPPTSD